MPNPYPDFPGDYNLNKIEIITASGEILPLRMGMIIELNEVLNDNPDIVNSNPFDEGWMLKLQISNMDENLNLMNAEKYKTFIS